VLGRRGAPLHLSSLRIGHDRSLPRQTGAVYSADRTECACAVVLLVLLHFSTMLDQSMNWQDAEDVRKKWGKQFCLKGIMSIADAKRAVDIGATGIMVSNQLDGSRSPFDQLAEIVNAVGDRIAEENAWRGR
jgi:FMN-dependent dehydrogenase